LYYQTTTSVGKYGASGSGLYGFQYGDGTNYGVGVRAYFANKDFPPMAVVASDNLADIRLYNRFNAPTGGVHVLGDLICLDSILHSCNSAGEPGTFIPVGSYINARTDEPSGPVNGQMWLRTDL